MPRSIGIRLVTSAFLLSGLMLATDGHGQPTPESPSPDPKRQRLIEDAQEIMRLSSQGQHDAVTKRVDDFISRYSLTQETFAVLLFKAESESRLGRIDPAIQSYQRAIPFVERLNNVAQRRYVLVFFRLGVLYRQKAQYDPAIRAVEAGLVRQPQNVYYQILLGELYRERGDTARALKHFRELLDSGVPTTEERLVLKIKIDRLTTPAPAAPLRDSIWGISPCTPGSASASCRSTSPTPGYRGPTSAFSSRASGLFPARCWRRSRSMSGPFSTSADSSMTRTRSSTSWSGVTPRESGPTGSSSR